MPTIKSDELVVINNGQILHGNEPVRYFASVKNTPEGRIWIKQLQKKNPQYKVVMFPTGTNRRERFAKAGKVMKTHHGVDAGFKLPWSVAERFRVYLHVIETKWSYDRPQVKFSDVVV